MSWKLAFLPGMHKASETEQKPKGASFKLSKTDSAIPCPKSESAEMGIAVSQIYFEVGLILQSTLHLYGECIAGK